LLLQRPVAPGKSSLVKALDGTGFTRQTVGVARPRGHHAARKSTAASTIFVSAAEFDAMVAQSDGFVEWAARARPPLRKRRARHWRERMLAGSDVVLEIDFQGATAIKQVFHQCGADLHPAAELGGTALAAGTPRRGRGIANHRRCACATPHWKVAQVRQVRLRYNQ
jgi:hypothetical protein